MKILLFDEFVSIKISSNFGTFISDRLTDIFTTSEFSIFTEKPILVEDLNEALTGLRYFVRYYDARSITDYIKVKDRLVTK